MMDEKHTLRSVTNIVSILTPLITAALVAVGVPIPGDALAPVLVSVVQSIATWWARNRKGGGGTTAWRVLR